MEAPDYARLCRQNQRLKAAVAALLLLVGAMLWLGASLQEPPPRRIEAREFLLNDQNGDVRARLSMRDGQPRLELYDEHGHVTWSTAGRFQPVQ